VGRIIIGLRSQKKKGGVGLKRLPCSLLGLYLMQFQNYVSDAGKWFIFEISRAKIPMGRNAIWCGSGYQRFLIGPSL
jgi:hypothetical protein